MNDRGSSSKGKKRKANQRVNFYCDFCKQQVHSKENFEEHNKSEFHAGKKKKLQDALVNQTNMCYTCEKLCSTKLELDEHCLLMRHQQLYRVQPIVKSLEELTKNAPLGSKTTSDAAISSAGEASDTSEPKKTNYYCKTCKLHCVSQYDYNRHLESWRHRAEVDNARDKTIEEAGSRSKKEQKVPTSFSERKGYYCDVCNVPCPDESGYVDHINGRKHHRKVSQLKPPFRCYSCTERYDTERDFKAHLSSVSHIKRTFKSGQKEVLPTDQSSDVPNKDDNGKYRSHSRKTKDFSYLLDEIEERTQGHRRERSRERSRSGSRERARNRSRERKRKGRVTRSQSRSRSRSHSASRSRRREHGEGKTEKTNEQETKGNLDDKKRSYKAKEFRDEKEDMSSDNIKKKSAEADENAQELGIYTANELGELSTSDIMSKSEKNRKVEIVGDDESTAGVWDLREKIGAQDLRDKISKKNIVITKIVAEETENDSFLSSLGPESDRDPLAPSGSLETHGIGILKEPIESESGDLREHLDQKALKVAEDLEETSLSKREKLLDERERELLKYHELEEEYKRFYLEWEYLKRRLELSEGDRIDREADLADLSKVEYILTDISRELDSQEILIREKEREILLEREQWHLTVAEKNKTRNEEYGNNNIKVFVETQEKAVDGQPLPSPKSMWSAPIVEKVKQEKIVIDYNNKSVGGKMYNLSDGTGKTSKERFNPEASHTVQSEAYTGNTSDCHEHQEFVQKEKSKPVSTEDERDLRQELDKERLLKKLQPELEFVDPSLRARIVNAILSSSKDSPQSETVEQGNKILAGEEHYDSYQTTKDVLSTKGRDDKSVPKGDMGDAETYSSHTQGLYDQDTYEHLTYLESSDRDYYTDLVGVRKEDIRMNQLPNEYPPAAREVSVEPSKWERLHWGEERDPTEKSTSKKNSKRQSESRDRHRSQRKYRSRKRSRNRSRSRDRSRSSRSRSSSRSSSNSSNDGRGRRRSSSRDQKHVRSTSSNAYKGRVPFIFKEQYGNSSDKEPRRSVADTQQQKLGEGMLHRTRDLGLAAKHDFGAKSMPLSSDSSVTAMAIPSVTSTYTGHVWPSSYSAQVNYYHGPGMVDQTRLQTTVPYGTLVNAPRPSIVGSGNNPASIPVMPFGNQCSFSTVESEHYLGRPNPQALSAAHIRPSLPPGYSPLGSAALQVPLPQHVPGSYLQTTLPPQPRGLTTGFAQTGIQHSVQNKPNLIPVTRDTGTLQYGNLKPVKMTVTQQGGVSSNINNPQKYLPEPPVVKESDKARSSALTAALPMSSISSQSGASKPKETFALWKSKTQKDAKTPKKDIWELALESSDNQEMEVVSTLKDFSDFSDEGNVERYSRRKLTSDHFANTGKVAGSERVMRSFDRKREIPRDKLEMETREQFRQQSTRSENQATTELKGIMKKSILKPPTKEFKEQPEERSSGLSPEHHLDVYQQRDYQQGDIAMQNYMTIDDTTRRKLLSVKTQMLRTEGISTLERSIGHIKNEGSSASEFEASAIPLIRDDYHREHHPDVSDSMLDRKQFPLQSAGADMFPTDAAVFDDYSRYKRLHKAQKESTLAEGISDASFRAVGSSAYERRESTVYKTERDDHGSQALDTFISPTKSISKDDHALDRFSASPSKDRWPQPINKESKWSVSETNSRQYQEVEGSEHLSRAGIARYLQSVSPLSVQQLKNLEAVKYAVSQLTSAAQEEGQHFSHEIFEASDRRPGSHLLYGKELDRDAKQQRYTRDLESEQFDAKAWKVGPRDGRQFAHDQFMSNFSRDVQENPLYATFESNDYFQDSQDVRREQASLHKEGLQDRKRVPTENMELERDYFLSKNPPASQQTPSSQWGGNSLDSDPVTSSKTQGQPPSASSAFLRCDLCRSLFSSEKSLNEHYSTEKHAASVKKKEAEEHRKWQQLHGQAATTSVVGGSRVAGDRAIKNSGTRQEADTASHTRVDKMHDTSQKHEVFYVDSTDASTSEREDDVNSSSYQHGGRGKGNVGGMNTRRLGGYPYPVVRQDEQGNISANRLFEGEESGHSDAYWSTGQARTSFAQPTRTRFLHRREYPSSRGGEARYPPSLMDL